MKKLIILFMMIISTLSFAGKKLYVGTNAEFKPYEYLEGDEITGFDIDFMNAIGKEIGYENTENFFRVFKKHYHMTPSQYRAAIQEETNMQTVCGDRDVIKR